MFTNTPVEGKRATKPGKESIHEARVYGTTGPLTAEDLDMLRVCNRPTMAEICSIEEKLIKHQLSSAKMITVLQNTSFSSPDLPVQADNVSNDDPDVSVTTGESVGRTYSVNSSQTLSLEQLTESLKESAHPMVTMTAPSLGLQSNPIPTLKALVYLSWSLEGSYRQ